jgi:hypothetical protein
MLSREVMGALALAILWVNVLLVAAAALKELGPIAAARRAFAAGKRGIVVRGAGAGGELAVHEVEQVGRATAAGTIRFSDRRFAGKVYGGTIRLEDGSEVEIEPQDDVEVWISRAVLAEAAGRDAATGYATALAAAKKARGHVRNLAAPIGLGTAVFVAEGRVSAIDPAAWAARASGLVVAFAIGEVALAAALTRLALMAPVFGTASTIGAALGLAFFLLVQPAGVSVREAVRPPSRANVRGEWSAPADAPATAPS